jgi:hypothetical protein
VIQGIGGPGEDGGFERGGWAVPHLDTETTTFVNEIYQRADAFLLRPVDLRDFRRFLAANGRPLRQPHRGRENTMPKYVASTTLTEPQWANTTVLSGEVVTAVGERKAKPGREVQVHGSCSLILSARQRPC